MIQICDKNSVLVFMMTIVYKYTQNSIKIMFADLFNHGRERQVTVVTFNFDPFCHLKMEARAETYIKGQTRVARKIPYWLWIVIAKILGIKLKPDDKPIISAILHIATFGSAAGLTSDNEWWSNFLSQPKY